MQCGAMFNNRWSLPSSEGRDRERERERESYTDIRLVPLGSWVQKLLDENSTCLFCGGHFEQIT